MNNILWQEVDILTVKWILTYKDVEILITGPEEHESKIIFVNSALSQELGGINIQVVKELFEWKYGIKAKPYGYKYFIKMTDQNKQYLKEISKKSRKKSLI